jgi:Transposase DDE domain group 1
MASDVLADARTGKNGRHALAGLFRQSVFGRLAGYEDVNDAERLRHDPAIRWMVGGKAAQRSAASPSQMGRFETQWLATGNPTNLAQVTRGQRAGGWSAVNNWSRFGRWAFHVCHDPELLEHELTLIRDQFLEVLSAHA